MCIICLKPEGVDMPTEKEIKHMFDRNPHGAGFALQGDIRGDGVFRVEYHKGFMNVDDLIEALGPREKLKNLTVAIHCRIKTSGETDKFTTHPFPISNQYADLRKTDGSGPVLFHNGVFSGLGGIIDKNSSDTQDFVVGVASRYLKNAKMPGKIAQVISGKIIGDCRVLIMYPKKNFPLLRWGNWYEHNGCYYSNMGYLDESKPTYNYSSHYHGSYGKKSSSSYRTELDEWGCNIAEYAWPSADDSWIRFDDERWKRLTDVIASRTKRAGETIVTFSASGSKEWILDEDNKQIYTASRRADVKLRQDEEDYIYDMEMDGMIQKTEEYIWFGDDEMLLNWLDQCQKVGEFEYKFQNKVWMVDTINCEAYTEKGLREYFSTGEIGHVRRQLKTQGYYQDHYKDSYVKDSKFKEEDDDELNQEMIKGLHYDDDYEEELETLRYGRS